MKIVQNKDFEKEFPSEVTGIMNDVTIFMNYQFMIQFKPEEKELAWNKAKELNGEADQVAKDSNGYEYIGW